MKLKALTATTAIVLALSSASAFAASVSITSITGIWTSATPNDTVNLDGIGTSSIEWGTESNATDSLSGYDFVAAGVPIAATESVNFVLGDFVHNNFTIAASPTPATITNADLQVTFGFTVDGGPEQQVVSSYSFLHNETTNNADPCADLGTDGVGVNINGCADSVTATLNVGSTQSFMIGGDEFVFNISGFEQMGIPMATFWTIENQSNEAQLVASYTTKASVVPLPAAGWMLLAGFGGLAAMKRRKKAA